MLVLIFGEDTFSSLSYLKKISNYYQERKDFNVHHFDIEEESAEEGLQNFVKTIKNVNLFALKRLIIAKNLLSFLKEKSKDNLLEFLKKYALPFKDIIIFYETTDQNKKIVDWFLNNQQKVKHFPLPDKKTFKLLIKNISKNYQYQLSPLVINLLMDYVYPDTWFLNQVLSKLSLINKKFIDEKTFKEYIFLPSQPYIFDFLDALILKNPIKTFYILEELKKEAGYHPLYIFKMIEKEIKNLMIIKKTQELKIKPPKNFSLNNFALRKLSLLASRLKFEELKKTYYLLFYYDKKIKEGALDAPSALDLLLFNILFSYKYVSI
ncbi:MAG: DNA polymerase III subunit delta [Minisyncoccia bacterium]